MKIGLLGDIHARIRPPTGRKDDWFEVQLGKFREALRIFADEGCQIVLQPGDMFDSPKPANMLLSRYLTELRASNRTLWAVLGQHDVYYHDVEKTERTALGIFESVGFANILKPDKPFRYADLEIWGASWGQEPKPLRRGGGTTRILVAHTSVGDKPLYPGHKLPSPTAYARKHPGYDLICLGDYHYRFLQDCDGTKVVNVGCMMRMRNAPRDRRQRPAVGIYDTETGNVEFRMLNHRPAEEVFVDKAEDEPKPIPELEEFLAGLKASGQLGTSFVKNLNATMDEKETGRDVRVVVSKILETVGVKDE